MSNRLSVARACALAAGVLMVGGAAVSQQGSSGRVERIAPRFDPRSVSQERAEEAGKLTKHHELLKKLEGQWNSKTLVYVAGRDPIENFGTTEVSSSLGGMFVEIESEGTFMGSAVEGKTTLGYDTYLKHYSASILSSQSTGMFFSKGLPTQDGAAIVLYGNMPDSMLGLTDRTVRTIIRMVDKDTWVWEVHDMYAAPLGVKVLETIYSR